MEPFCPCCDAQLDDETYRKRAEFNGKKVVLDITEISGNFIDQLGKDSQR